MEPADLEQALGEVAQQHPIGLVLPITATDLRAPAFANMVEQLSTTSFLESIVVVLNRADSVDDYRLAASLAAPLGDRADVLWTDGARVSAIYDELATAGFDLSSPGKGRAVWTAFGHLLADPELRAIAVNDCDVVNYHRDMLVRLCLPIAHPGFDFDFVKAYYARSTTRMHGRVSRLLVAPVLQAMIRLLGSDEFLVFLRSYRYPLSGEFAVSTNLAKANRIPGDWGLEVGMLAEVFRNASPKRCCQVDLGRPYEHKHQVLDVDDPEAGLLKMAGDILMTLFRTLASRGVVFPGELFASLTAAYLREAQDAIRQYHADATMNGLSFDRHGEEHIVDAFARQIARTGVDFHHDPSGADAIPTWTRVLSALPDVPAALRAAAKADAAELALP